LLQKCITFETILASELHFCVATGLARDAIDILLGFDHVLVAEIHLLYLLGVSIQGYTLQLNGHQSHLGF
jgi:hypothetical protein